MKFLFSLFIMSLCASSVNARGDVVCSSLKCVEQKAAANEVIVSKEDKKSLFAVKCCSDTPKEHFVATPDYCGDLYVSAKETNGVCIGATKTYYKAEKICKEKHGARLCTAQENLSDCTRATQCSNSERAWTSPSTALSMANVACASQKCVDNQAASGAVTDVVPTESLYSVRCCADSALPGFVSAPTSCGNLWVSSEDGSGQCTAPGKATYFYANAICESQGARLCTVNENLNDCTRPAKCGSNNSLVWSGPSMDSLPFLPTPQPTPKATTSAPTLSDAVVSCASVQCEVRPRVERISVGSQYGVRCCSDTELPGFVKSVNPACTVWASSNDSTGECAPTGVTYDTAKEICEAHGARLCTVKENLDNCTKPARCGINTSRVWTSSGDEVFNTEAPTPAPVAVPAPTTSEAVVSCASVQCTIQPDVEVVDATTASYGVRCCSDTKLPGFVKSANPECTVWASSNDSPAGECASTTVTYDTAKEICEDQGGRLCTSQENLANCSKPARCGINTLRVWTSDSTASVIGIVTSNSIAVTP